MRVHWSMSAALVTAVLATACSGDLYETNDDLGDPGAATEEIDPAAPGAPDLAYAQVDPWGPVLVDEAGYTLYLSGADRPAGAGWDAVSRCTGSCAEQWIPVVVEEPVLAEGMDESSLGWLTRDDDAQQLTWAGWPVYRFTGDAAPGEAYGEGYASQWFVIPQVGYTHLPTKDEAGYDWLVTADGRAVYYLEDETPGTPAKDPVVTCLDGCLDRFSPVAGPLDLPSALDPDDTTTFWRPDGTEQVAYRGRPLYTFVDDVYPGDHEAHGLGDRWYRVDPYEVPPVVTEIVLDFDDLPPNSRFEDGLTIATPAGSVAVTSDLDPAVNPLAVFDAECGGDAANCTGQDPDLFQPGQGQILIAQDETNADEPDDANSPVTFTFDLSGLACATIEITSFLSIDAKTTDFSTIPSAVFPEGFVDTGFPSLEDGLSQRFAGDPILVDQGIFHLYVWDSGAVDDITIQCTNEGTSW